MSVQEGLDRRIATIAKERIAQLEERYAALLARLATLEQQMRANRTLEEARHAAPQWADRLAALIAEFTP